MSSIPDTGIQRQNVVDLIITSAQDVQMMNSGAETDAAQLTEETRLIGQGAILDSLGLVSLIVEVEQRLADELDLTLILADERAMSQKRSPFRSVGSLADYICELVAEQGISIGR